MSGWFDHSIPVTTATAPVQSSGMSGQEDS